MILQLYLGGEGDMMGKNKEISKFPQCPTPQSLLTLTFSAWTLPSGHPWVLKRSWAECPYSQYQRIWWGHWQGPLAHLPGHGQNLEPATWDWPTVSIFIHIIAMTTTKQALITNQSVTTTSKNTTLSTIDTVTPTDNTQYCYIHYYTHWNTASTTSETLYYHTYFKTTIYTSIFTIKCAIMHLITQWSTITVPSLPQTS